MKLIVFFILVSLLIGLPACSIKKANWSKKELVIRVLQQVAKEVGIDPRHLVGVCGAETVWDRTATGNRHKIKKAHGLCQVKTATARDMKFKGPVRDLYWIIPNATVAAKYLLWLEERFKDWKVSESRKWDLVYVSYYAGVDWVKNNLDEALRKSYIFHVKNCYTRINQCRR